MKDSISWVDIKVVAIPVAVPAPGVGGGYFSYSDGIPAKDNGTLSRHGVGPVEGAGGGVGGFGDGNNTVDFCEFKNFFVCGVL